MIIFKKPLYIRVIDAIAIGILMGAAYAAIPFLAMRNWQEAGGLKRAAYPVAFVALRVLIALTFPLYALRSRIEGRRLG
jgi:hypothetical protein